MIDSTPSLPNLPSPNTHTPSNHFFIFSPHSLRHTEICAKINNMKTKKNTLSPKSSAKTRTKPRKHNKFISLRRKLSQGEITHDHHHQLNLFPLHPENLFEEKEDYIHGDNVAYLFEADGDDNLNGLLWEGEGLVSSHEEGDSLSPSLTYAYGGHDSEEGASSLERTALRHKERDDSEEKWVFYSEVVEKKEEEVSSCSLDYGNQKNRLSLKLDYQEIMNAWSDRGSLYIDGDRSQIVPDILDDALAQDSINELLEVGSMANVPQIMRAVEEDGRCTMGEREARVLRYKEKRQSRLFSKRIRYQVRKLNAEKRPRMKGRFVKRS